jgi:large subunit ribosomal protein L25
MRIAFELSAEPRNDQGKGASRRLRHSGKVPAILYGAHAEPVRLSLEHHKLLPLVADEKFYSSIISVNVGAQKQPVIVKDVQMHPARNAIVHLDLQRVLENEKIRLHLPIHFKGEAASPGVKTQGGVVSHHMADMEVTCLPKDLPEYIELDLSAMNLNDTLYLTDIKVPAGVTISALAHGANPPVVSIHAPRVAEPEPTAETVAATTEGAVAAAGTEGAPAAPAADAKKEEGKKDEGKGAKKEGGKK